MAKNKSAKTTIHDQTIRHGITLGACLAVTISWSVNQSILWAILHGVFSWLYVIYYAIRIAD